MTAARTRGGRALPGSRPEIPLEAMLFRLGADTYAIPLECIVEAVALPRGATYGRTMEVRGEALPVHPAEAVLEVGGDPLASTKGLVVRLEGATFVLAVEEVVGVRTLDEAALVPPPRSFPERTASAVRGLIPTPEGLIVLLDSGCLRWGSSGAVVNGIGEGGVEETR